MKRHTIQPRADYQAILESQGMTFHTFDDVPYWDESVYYEFTEPEIDTLEAATDELNRICLEAVEHVVSQNRLTEMRIPALFHRLICDSWEREPHTIYGRFDLSFDGQSPPKMLEYNADTPTGLIESAVAQWYWLQDQFSGRNQFNSIHERLIEAWKAVQVDTPGRMVFTARADNVEDFMTVNYLRDTAIQAGWDTHYINIEDIGWNATRRLFVDLGEVPIHNCFKLYPWEWLQLDSFGAKLNFPGTKWLEPPWKAILSNKSILPILWELFPGHDNLLPASFEPLQNMPYVQKPILSREGANIQLFEHGRLLVKTEGPYTGPSIYQQLWKLPNFDGHYPMIGSWIVNGWSCGIGIREDDTLVTGNLSRFVPHVFGA